MYAGTLCVLACQLILGSRFVLHEVAAEVHGNNATGMIEVDRQLSLAPLGDKFQQVAKELLCAFANNAVAGVFEPVWGILMDVVGRLLLVDYRGVNTPWSHKMPRSSVKGQFRWGSETPNYVHCLLSTAMRNCGLLSRTSAMHRCINRIQLALSAHAGGAVHGLCARHVGRCWPPHCIKLS